MILDNQKETKREREDRGGCGLERRRGEKTQRKSIGGMMEGGGRVEEGSQNLSRNHREAS